jgi:hypothetical protein
VYWNYNQSEKMRGDPRIARSPNKKRKKRKDEKKGKEGREESREELLVIPPVFGEASTKAHEYKRR